MNSLYKYFETDAKIKTLEDAKRFYSKWVNKWEQEIPGYPEFSGENTFSMRAMAGHLSCYLTGDQYNSDYLFTKHGTEIYWAMGKIYE